VPVVQNEQPETPADEQAETHTEPSVVHAIVPVGTVGAMFAWLAQPDGD
jgi:hypothetical protein